MGETMLSDGEVLRLIRMLEVEWHTSNYELLRRNCCHFADQLCTHLGVGGIPSWITSLAEAGAAVEDKVSGWGRDWSPGRENIGNRSPMAAHRSVSPPPRAAPRAVSPPPRLAFQGPPVGSWTPPPPTNLFAWTPPPPQEGWRSPPMPPPQHRVMAPPLDQMAHNMGRVSPARAGRSVCGGPTFGMLSSPSVPVIF